MKGGGEEESWIFICGTRWCLDRVGILGKKNVTERNLLQRGLGPLSLRHSESGQKERECGNVERATASRVGGLRGIVGKEEAFEAMESQVPPNGGNVGREDIA